MLDEIKRGTERTGEGLDACARLLRKLTPYIGKLAGHAADQHLGFDPLHELAPPLQDLDDLMPTLRHTAGRPSSRTPPPPPGVDDGPCTFHGSAPALPVATMLQFLSTQNKSGALQIATANENVTIGMVSGAVVHAVSDATPLDHRLGSLLLKRGALGAEELTDLLAQSYEDGIPLGQRIEDEELVERDDLRAALEQQVQLLFDRLFAEPEAEFAFYEGSEVRPDVQIDMDMTRLLLESARTVDDNRNAPVGAWEDWLK